MQEKNELLKRLALAVQNALLGNISPNLRAVLIDVDIEKKILFFFFFYDGVVGDKLFDLASVSCTEASSHFPEYKVKEQIESLNFPEKIPSKGRLVYLREE